MIPEDTTQTIRRLQFERLRAMTTAERHAITEDLTATTMQLSREAIAARLPHATKAEVMVRWIELVYGLDLADRIRPYAHRLGVGPS